MSDGAGAGPGWTPAVLDEFTRATGMTLDRGVRARHFAASDWGGIVFGNPAAVVRPRSAEEVAIVVRWAGDRGLKLTVRGTGASSGGQSVADGSVTIDTTALDQLAVDAQRSTLECGPGTTWRTALLAAFAHGLQPVVMPLQLDLTVGGTISVGGFGAVGHRFGVAGAHVAGLEVVTGDGHVQRCSPELDGDLFDAVRGGLGRCGVITRIVLNLRPAPPRVRVLRFRSATAESWTAAVAGLAGTYGSEAASHVVHVEGFCRSDGGRLVYDLHLGIEHADDEADLTVSGMEGMVGLPGNHELLASEDVGLVQYAARLDPRFEEMVSTGRTGDGHPWVECLLAPDTFQALLPDVMAGIAGDAGDRIQIVSVRRSLLPPLIVSPPEELLVCIVIVPRGITRDLLPRAMDAMARVNRLLVEAGGKRYLAGWLPEVDEATWRRHFGERYDGWLAARQRYDPAGTFTSALFAGAAAEARPGKLGA